MNLKISDFGDVLVSRPAGKEAFLVSRAYIFDSLADSEIITLDFEGVKVLTPSWADEFISGIKALYSNTLVFSNTSNPSVEASLRAVS